MKTKKNQKYPIVLIVAPGFLMILLLSIPATINAQETMIKDIVFAEHDGTSLTCDIYLPPIGNSPCPVVVWIHGGAFKSGSKENPRGLFLVKQGFALVSINYRISGDAKFPAQIYDCKAAIRWLRANGGKYNLETKKIGVMGSSAGGQLVALLGTSGGVRDLEGSVGGNLSYSSRVDAVCDLWGPSNFLSMVNQPSEMNHEDEKSPEGQLLGGAVLKNQELARKASPVTYISKNTPPFLIIHGDSDPTVPFQQSIELDSLLRLNNRVSELHIIKGMKHGGPEFETDEVRNLIINFFKNNLIDHEKK